MNQSQVFKVTTLRPSKGKERSFLRTLPYCNVNRQISLKAAAELLAAAQDDMKSLQKQMAALKEEHRAVAKAGVG